MYLVVALHGHGESDCGAVERGAHRVQAAHELARGAQHLEHLGAHARHHVHVGDHVGRVGDLHADARDRRADRTHAVGDHVHRAPLHRAGEQPVEGVLHLGRVAPVVGRAGVLAVLRADEGELLDARDIRGVGAHEHAVGALHRVEPRRGAGLHHDAEHVLVLALGAVTPHHPVGLAHRGHVLHPGFEDLVVRHRVRLIGQRALGRLAGKRSRRVRPFARCGKGVRLK